MAGILSASLLCLSVFASGVIEIPLTRKPPQYVPLSLSTPLNHSLLSAESWTEDLINSFNMEYTGEVMLGTPPQSVHLIFDTGSSWLWATSDQCEMCNANSVFSPDKSSTFFSTGKTKHLYYGQGDCEGIISTDIASVAGATVTSQDFILVSSENDFSGSVDGILGLAFKKLSDGYMTFVERLYEDKVIEEKVFAVYLNTINETDMSSSITLGGSDVSKYFPANYTNEVNITDSGYWSVKLTYTKVFTSVVSISSSLAILDTGTSLLILSPKDFRKVVLALTAEQDNCQQDQSGMVFCPCQDENDFPTLTVGLGNYEFDISPNLYIQLQAQDGQNWCVLLIGVMDLTIDGRDAWILGDVFLRGYYTVFDMGRMVAGIAGGRNATVIHHSSGSSGLSKGAIAGIVVAVVVVFCAVVGLLFYCIRKKRMSQQYAGGDASLTTHLGINQER